MHKIQEKDNNWMFCDC